MRAKLEIVQTTLPVKPPVLQIVPPKIINPNSLKPILQIVQPIPKIVDPKYPYGKTSFGKRNCMHGVYHYNCKKCPGKGICIHNICKSTCKECKGGARCEHGRMKSQCKECGGGSICIHNRVKYKCKECAGSSVCEHKKIRSACKECHGGSICEHNKMRYICKECGGSQICEHNKIKNQCRECGGTTFCMHNKRKYECKECGGKGICKHNKIKKQCRECGGKSFCEHNIKKYFCRECGGKGICQHDRYRSQCKECIGSQICEHNGYKSRCKHCRRNLPLETVLSKYKNSCLLCGAPTNTSKQKMYGMCSDCMTPDMERPELVWKGIIENNFEFKPSTADETVYSLNCKSDKYRPDLTFHTPELIIILELDEDSHDRYDVDCEIKRTVNIKDAYPEQRVLMIRMNPDKNEEIPDELLSLESRTCYMLEVMKQYLDIEGDLFNELEEGITNVIYLFYGDKGKKHIEEANINVDSVNVVDTHYC
jgi:hypothetical protein